MDTEDILRSIEDVFETVDDERVAGLEQVRTIQSIKNESLERERVRLARKYGEDHPRIQKIDSRLVYNQSLLKDLAVEIDRSKVEVPAIDANTWMVHGRVLDKTRAGIAGLTVSLFDEKGKWIREMGYSCTDERGYFAITYSAKEDGKQGSQRLFLTVTDREHRVLHREREPLCVRLGWIDYREMVIDDQGDVCLPPEPDKDEKPAPADSWIVRGRVTDEKKQGVGGLTIGLYDKEHVFDDVLGTTLTDDDGKFRLTYQSKEFKDLFEKKPEVYLRVTGKRKKILYTSDKAVKCKAGREEIFNIAIKSGAEREESERRRQ
jgi:hypothetical protein